MSNAFDIEAAKRGEPVEIKVYRIVGSFLDDWKRVHFIGISLDGYPVVQDDNDISVYKTAVENLRMAPKKIKVRYRVYLWKDFFGDVRPGILDPKRSEREDPSSGKDFIQWIHTDWQEAEVEL